MKKKLFRKLKIAHLFTAALLLVAMASLTSCERKIDIPAKPIRYNFETVSKDALWRSIAASTLIVKGVFQVDTNKIKEIKESKNDYIEIKLIIDSVLKGNIPPKEITIQDYICSKDWKWPYCDETDLVQFNKKRTIILLGKDGITSQEIYIYSNPYYKIESIFLESEESKIKEEIAKQEMITKDVNLHSICSNDSVSSKVKNLIENMLIKANAEEAYAELEKMGFDAVPSIICHMDDRRDLALKGISLKNKNPEFWEANRHYGPKVIVDVLAAILNQITNECFNFIYNGGNEEERANEVRAWRTYLWHAVNDNLEQHSP
jgi:hypothetical protein